MNQRQRSDGTWGPCEPLPWNDRIDWEIYGRGRSRVATAYWHDKKLVTVKPGRFFGLRLALANRRLLRSSP